MTWRNNRPKKWVNTEHKAQERDNLFFAKPLGTEN